MTVHELQCQLVLHLWTIQMSYIVQLGFATRSYPALVGNLVGGFVKTTGLFFIDLPAVLKDPLAFPPPLARRREPASPPRKNASFESSSSRSSTS